MPYARSQYVPIGKMLRNAEKQSKHQRSRVQFWLKSIKLKGAPLCALRIAQRSCSPVVCTKAQVSASCLGLAVHVATGLHELCTLAPRLNPESARMTYSVQTAGVA